MSAVFSSTLSITTWIIENDGLPFNEASVFTKDSLSLLSPPHPTPKRFYFKIFEYLVPKELVPGGSE